MHREKTRRRPTTRTRQIAPCPMSCVRGGRAASGLVQADAMETWSMTMDCCEGQPETSRLAPPAARLRSPQPKRCRTNGPCSGEQWPRLRPSEKSQGDSVFTLCGMLVCRILRRQHTSKCCPDPGLRFDVNLTAMLFDDAFACRQSDSRSRVLFSRVQFEKRSEYFSEMLVGDSDSVVSDGHDTGFADLHRRQFDRRCRFRQMEFQRIGDEVLKELDERRLVAIDRRHGTDLYISSRLFDVRIQIL